MSNIQKSEGALSPELENKNRNYDMQWSESLLSDCTLCPRHCHVNRLLGQVGYCGQTTLKAARASLHMWEEPCISGTAGSGTVFFSGCNLRCIFCQNYHIALGEAGREISTKHLAEIFLSLQAQGANNINLVTPTHFVPQILLALQSAKEHGLTIPIVYNSSGYESTETLRLLEGYVDIYLPDFKYMDPALSLKYSHGAGLFYKSKRTLAEMVRQAGSPVFDPATGLMKRGVIVRHLLLPGHTKDSKKILRYLHTTYGNQIFISIMNQYTPLPQVKELPELNRRVSPAEYERVLDFALRIGIENGFFQEGETASDSFIPEFDERGL